MSAAWTAVLVAGAGSYLLRLVPLLLAGRFAVSDRTAATLRDAGTAALAALLVTAVIGADAARNGGDRLLLWAALAVSAGLLVARRSVPVVVLGGSVVYATGALLPAVL